MTPEYKEELRDKLADIQRLTRLNDEAWCKRFGNTEGLYGLFITYYQQQLERAVREARLDELDRLAVADKSGSDFDGWEYLDRRTDELRGAK